MSGSRVRAGRTGLAVGAAAVCAGVLLGLPGVFGGLLGTAGAVVGFGTGPGGGGNTTFTTSTTHHTTYTRVDLPDVQAYQTTVLAYLHGTGGGASLVFQQTVPTSIGSPGGQGAVAQAASALQAAGAGSIPGPALVASATSAHTDFLGNQVNHIDQTVTTTQTFGPATILIGDDQSQTFFVAAGTENFNTNTHYETFVDQRYQRTNTLSQTYQLDATVAALPPLTLTDHATPGQPVTVSGTSCTKAVFGGSAGTGGTIQVTIGFSPPLVLPATAAGTTGAWSVHVTVPPGTPAGVYPVTATCNDPVAYPAAALTIGTPAATAAPATPAAAIPAGPHTAG